MKSEQNTLQALIDGLHDGGVQIVTNFPGFKSHELFSGLGGKTTSINEKAAYEIAWGASLAGKRSVVTFKNVGLDDAADPFLNSMLLKINAGLVVVVFDDVEVTGSQSRQDSRHYFDFFGGLWFEPYSTESAYEIALNSFNYSEKLQVPVVIRLTNEVLSKSGSYKRSKIRTATKSLKHDKIRFVVHPVNAKLQNKELENKNLEIRKFVENLYSKATASGVIAFGDCEREINALPISRENVFQVYTLPTPNNTLKKNFAKSKEIKVFEQGTSYGAEKVSAIFSSKEVVSNSGDFVDHSKGHIITKNYETMFQALKNTKPQLVVGDLGEYTMDNLHSIDACLCFGSAISVSIGASLAGVKDIFCIIGDAAFLHSGKNVIAEALERNLKLNIIVICNGGSQGTGGQKIPGDLKTQNKSIISFTEIYDDLNVKKFGVLFEQMKKSKQMAILYLVKK